MASGWASNRSFGWGRPPRWDRSGQIRWWVDPVMPFYRWWALSVPRKGSGSDVLIIYNQGGHHILGQIIQTDLSGPLLCPFMVMTKKRMVLGVLVYNVWHIAVICVLWKIMMICVLWQIMMMAKPDLTPCCGFEPGGGLLLLLLW